MTGDGWKFALVLISAIATSAPVFALDALVEGFRSPPAAARPRVWWHWIGGNVTQEGVRLDLAWMKRVGIGGVQNFDVSFEGAPVAAFRMAPVVEKPLDYLTPAWRQALRYSVAFANEQGLEFGISSAPGWGSGGPWVKPQWAMKKLVWSETWVQGGRAFKGRLTKPPQTTGLFQNIPSVELGARGGGSSKAPFYYADVVTIAYRAPASEVPPGGLEQRVTSSAGAIDAARLSDGDLAKTVSLPFGDGRDAWIQFAFAKQQRIQAVTAVIGGPLLGVNPLLESNRRGWLEASDDGRTFHKVIDLPEGGSPQQTVSFRPTLARVFRVVFKRPESGLVEELGFAAPAVAHQVAELVLQTAARVNRFEDKAGYSSRQIVAADDTPAVSAGDVVHRGDIVDLTSKMRADGSLDWTPPAGRWIILRFGYSLIGRTNRPASRAATGLEVDKLNRAYVKSYIDAYLGEYEKTLGSELMGGHGLQYIVTDSYEAGAQNWTDDMLNQFRQRRGYEALPWLPVLAGRVVESAVASDRFLWDFRKTIGELMAEAHYGQISASLHERGLGRYGESHEVGRAFVGDGMEAKKTADIPMGAMWAARLPGYTLEGSDADIRESASVAHIYGKNLVAAESFTAYGNPYGFAPETLKPAADRELAMGLNRFVIHTSVHQPDNKPGPGLGFGPFGQWFTRKETWAEQASSWVAYLTRSSYLLQQGQFVADIAYLYGEDTNVTALFGTSAVPVPDGYNFDFINADAVLDQLSVKGGRLATRGGMEYRVLALDASTQRISLPVLRKIRDLVRAGAVVVGNKPSATPSLADDEGKFRAIVAELWGEGAPRERAVGSGKVFAYRSLAEALMAMHIPPDVSFEKVPNTKPRFVHRALLGGDLYFVSNGTANAESTEASFRMTGRQPELWRADTGTIEPVSYRVENGRTIVPLELDPNDAVFIVFRHPTDVQKTIIHEPTTEVLATLQGPWDVSFPPHVGAPTHARFDRLYSWTDSNNIGVRYLSGTAAYEKTVPIPGKWLKDRSRVQLNLGEVKNLAEVIVNGRSVGVVWKKPFKLDITDALKPGDNRIEIRVTNLWRNRLIGDKQPGARRVAFASFDPFKAESQLLESGLLGPVSLLRVSN